MPTDENPRDWRCPPGFPNEEQKASMRAERLKWERIIAATPPANPPHDIERLIKERPEMFDYQDVPANLNIDPKTEAALDRLRPQWMKDELAKVERHAEPAEQPDLD